MKKIFLAAIVASSLAISASAQLFNFTTFAGSAGQGDADGAATNSQFLNPGGVAMDVAGNIYVADTGNHTIRKIAADGTVSTLAGSPGIAGNVDGTNALFTSPQGIAADNLGNIFVADTGNFTIRKISSDGSVSTFAGCPGISGHSDGAGTNAQFFEPEGIAVDAADNLFVADTWNQTIRQITTAGAVTTVAGLAGNPGYADASGTNALFFEPSGIAVDSTGTIFVADTGNNVIRKITPTGIVTTLAGAVGNFGNVDGSGTNAWFNSPQGISLAATGTIFVADYLNHTIREITAAGAVTTIAGAAGIFGSTDGTNSRARFFGPQAVVVNPTNNNFVYVADTGNSVIRQLDAAGNDWAVDTLAGNASIGTQDLTGTSARFFWPMGAAMDAAGNIFVADTANHTIRKIIANGTVSTFAGQAGVTGSADGSDTNALFNSPQALAVDSSGNIFVADTGNSTIRAITADGSVRTLAGSPGIFGSSDGTNSTAQFFAPSGIAADASGNLFVADSFNHLIRKITAAGVVTTLAGVAGNSGSFDGTNGAAQFNRPTGMAIDGTGNIFVTDQFNHTIRKITPAGVVSTPAGLAGVFGSADGTNGGARFFEPEGIAVDGSGNIFVADAGNHALRQLTPSGTNWVVSTIAGWPGNSGSTDGSGIAAQFCYPAGLAMNPAGKLFVVDAGNNAVRAGAIITDQPPIISTQPQSQSVNVGTAVTFGVGATGSSPLYYQWQFNGGNIPGAVDANFTLTSAQPANAGTYSVIVRSPTGSASSSNAILAVFAPPVITNQPVSQTCLQGSTITVNVLAGPPPLTYQWAKNGTPLSNSGNVSGATTATLTLNNVTTADSASYSVRLNNGYGYITSSAVTLTVFLMPPADSPSPVAWWQLNEGSGAQAFDYSGNGHTGTLNSGATWTNAGYAGPGVYFNGTNFADITINNTFTVSGNWTATMWINRWGSKDSSVILGGSHDALKLEQHAQANHVGYTAYGVQDYSLSYTTPLNTWTHLAYVKTSSGVSLYVNGAFTASNTGLASLDATTLGLGYPTVATDYLDATLNDVRLYTTALTVAQITNLITYDRISPLPTITLTAPTNGASYVVSGNINLAANVISNGQSLVRVEFYSGTNLLGLTSIAPYVWTWTNVPGGNYLLTARVIFNGTNLINSGATGISVVPSTVQTNLTFALADQALQLVWPLDHTGWRLQSQTNSSSSGLGTNWMDVPGATLTNLMSFPISPTNSSVFYRLIYP